MVKTIYWYEHRFLETKIEKDIFGLMNNAIFGKTMGNVRKRKGIKLVTPEKIETIWHQNQNFFPNFFSENLLAIEVRKKLIISNKSG